jgi:membrane-associated phospholipid phosphatase
VLTFAFPRLAAPLFVLAAAVAFSRVYVGVHYPLDVIGGAVLGALVATALRRLVTGRLRSRQATPAG